MSFMQHQVIKGDWWEVDGNVGTEVFPAEYFSRRDARNDYSGCRIDGETFRKGWFGARLSAPGYMDCTEWSVFPTKELAQEYLHDNYPEDDDIPTDEECGD